MISDTSRREKDSAYTLGKTVGLGNKNNLSVLEDVYITHSKAEQEKKNNFFSYFRVLFCISAFVPADVCSGLSELLADTWWDTLL